MIGLSLLNGSVLFYLTLSVIASVAGYQFATYQSPSLAILSFVSAAVFVLLSISCLVGAEQERREMKARHHNTQHL